MSRHTRLSTNTTNIIYQIITFVGGVGPSAPEDFLTTAKRNRIEYERGVKTRTVIPNPAARGISCRSQSEIT